MKNYFFGKQKENDVPEANTAFTKRMNKGFLTIFAVFVAIIGILAIFKPFLNQILIVPSRNASLSSNAEDIKAIDVDKDLLANTISNENYQLALSNIEQLKQKLEQQGISNKFWETRDREKVILVMHEITNTKIIADNIWGLVEPTEQNINYLLLEVNASNYPDKEQLLKMLNHWKVRNFSNCVDEHNYLWSELHGTVGKARALRPGV